MTNEKFSGSERRNQSHKMINELLTLRQQVWSLYCKIADLEPFSADKPIDSTLDEFCQVMVDYISLGHFGIYQRIADGKERRGKVIETAEQTYPRIADTTQSAVEFNDKYEKLNGNEMLVSLSADLSQLGEELALRIELEDHLIEAVAA